MTNIAIIPARGGSKRVPRKNIRLFSGKPMIAHSIDLALQSGIFDRVIVSTDDDEIAAVAKDYGAEVPFIRPAALSGDFSLTVDVIQHSVAVLALQPNDCVCCLYATAPFARQQDLAEGLALLHSTDADYTFPVANFPSPVQRCLVMSSNGFLRPMYPQYAEVRTQHLEQTYHDVGQFY